MLNISHSFFFLFVCFYVQCDFIWNMFHIPNQMSLHPNGDYFLWIKFDWFVKVVHFSSQKASAIFHRLQIDVTIVTIKRELPLVVSSKYTEWQMKY